MWTEFRGLPTSPNVEKTQAQFYTHLAGGQALGRVQTMIDGDEAKSGLACTPNGLTMPRAFRHPEHRVAMIQTLHGNEVSRNG